VTKVFPPSVVSWLRSAARLITLLILSAPADGWSEELNSEKAEALSAHETAYRLADPIPNLFTVPFQFNYDRGYGSEGDGRVFTGKVQPVVPIKLSEEYSYYVRTVIPYQWQNDGDGYDVDGFGVPLIETFFSRTVEERSEFSIGPFVSPPALSGSRFGTQQTGAGVSWLGIVRPGDWAIGLFGYQSFAIGGSDAGGTANSTYLQPFISYVTREAVTYSINTESTTTWDPGSFSAPVNLTVEKAVIVGDLPVSFAVCGRYYVESADEGASGFGGRLQVTFVLPRFS
jgi:hypothetical protein